MDKRPCRACYATCVLVIASDGDATITRRSDPEPDSNWLALGDYADALDEIDAYLAARAAGLTHGDALSAIVTAPYSYA